jgi:lipoprotein-anchoring transpeptidase ErfK/SrfK
MQFSDRRRANGLKGLSWFAAAAIFALSGSGIARADDRSFLALFEDAAPASEQYPAGAEDMVASYNDGRDETETGTRLARETPSTTREIVPDPTEEKPGTITVDTQNRYLYLSMPNGQAIRYGVGVGREGFTWKGRTRIGRKESWPGWTPPREMLKRRPDLPRHMSGGEDNPLGARAMYLYSGNRDTMFRIHGSNEPWSIGQAVSSGCIRMLNADVTDLFNHVKVGTTVNVL